jgi:putative ATP-dependent endonuclease of the OLD family
MEEKDKFIKIKSLKIRNYRSFGNKEQVFDFDPKLGENESKKPIAIVGYNNAGKINLMNAILYGIGHKYISEKTFERNDLFNLEYQNQIEINSEIDGSEYKCKKYWNKEIGDLSEEKSIRGNYTIKTNYENDQLFSECSPSFFGTSNHYQIFYINFHKIKDEISTQKTSWGNLRSFLAKHIQKLVEQEKGKPNFEEKKSSFNETNKSNVQTVLEDTRLLAFIETIKSNYSKNLRDNTCDIDFGLPDYEDIFLEMIFKIGLNGDKKRLIPIDHFGDGYISMFVMAVIQAIAEENEKDKCLFLFEEPESFLHENHQEYFYKRVLCGLAEKGHQVIYTTHSDKMVDITSPETLIRLEFDKDKKQTIKTFPSETNKVNPLNKPENKEIFPEFNSYIKNIEPNLNKILFSDKVLLVEGPNDLLVYNYLIKKKAEELKNNTSKADPVKLAETHLNFNNIVIIPHHGKHTAYLLAALCKYLGVDYYLINDWDFEATELDIEEIGKFDLEKELKGSELYTSQTDTSKKGMITTNWKIIKSAKNGQIHFNVKKLESVIGYYNKENKDTKEDKNPMKIWKTIKGKYQTASDIGVDIFPESLEKFLLLKENEKEKDSVSTLLSEIPF